MRRLWRLFLAAALALAVCTGCHMMKRIEAGRNVPVAPDVTETAEPTPETGTETPEPAPGETPAPEPTHEPSAEPETEESCAYITAMSMGMDGQTDISFDYVDWLYGEEARTRYLEDYPDSDEDALEIIENIGYIRNMNTMLRTYRTGPDTRYFLPDEEDLALIVEVTYDTFRDRMFPAAEGTGDTYLTFVKVYVAGETIQKIEWLYTP